MFLDETSLTVVALALILNISLSIGKQLLNVDGYRPLSLRIISFILTPRPTPPIRPSMFI